MVLNVFTEIFNSESFKLFYLLTRTQIFAQKKLGKMWTNFKDFEGISDDKPK